MKIVLFPLLFLVASLACFGGEPDGDEEWNAALRETMEKKIVLDVREAPLKEGVQALRNQSKIFIVLSPELSKAETKVSLRLDNVSMKDGIDQFCKVAAVRWDIRYGAIFIYPTGVAPMLPKKPVSNEEWGVATFKKLSRKVSLEFVDTPMTDALQFIKSFTQVETAFDPKFENQDKVLINLCPVRNMRADDAITWICFLAGAEWTLKKSNDSIGTIWISTSVKN